MEGMTARSHEDNRKRKVTTHADTLSNKTVVDPESPQPELDYHVFDYIDHTCSASLQYSNTTDSPKARRLALGSRIAYSQQPWTACYIFVPLQHNGGRLYCRAKSPDLIKESTTDSRCQNETKRSVERTPARDGTMSTFLAFPYIPMRALPNPVCRINGKAQQDKFSACNGAIERGLASRCRIHTSVHTHTLASGSAYH